MSLENNKLRRHQEAIKPLVVKYESTLLLKMIQPKHYDALIPYFFQTNAVYKSATREFIASYLQSKEEHVNTVIKKMNMTFYDVKEEDLFIEKLSQEYDVMHPLRERLQHFAEHTYENIIFNDTMSTVNNKKLYLETLISLSDNKDISSNKHKSYFIEDQENMFWISLNKPTQVFFISGHKLLDKEVFVTNYRKEIISNLIHIAKKIFNEKDESILDSASINYTNY